MTAFYNDTDPFVASWLESLITHGHIAPGRVDRRSIADLTPADVAGPGQRHFFAGIGGWSYALRLAGIHDDTDIWTGSCPCQPFSDAGQGGGVLDPRHLWPAWFSLIEQCLPPIIFGEQVASRDGLGWLDLVYTDLERCGYTVGSADLCAASVGAPHVRQRLYFVAYTDREQGRLLVRARQPRDADAQARRGGKAGLVANEQQTWGQLETPERGGEARPLGNPAGERSGRRGKRAAHRRSTVGPEGGGFQRGRGANIRARGTGPEEYGQDGVVADNAGVRRRQGRQAPSKNGAGPTNHSSVGVMGDASGTRSGGDSGGIHRTQASSQGQGDQPRRLLDVSVAAGATGGFWRDAEWILCRDPAGGSPVARPVEPGTFPLVTGLPGRVGLLRGYGNSIVPPVVARFIRAALASVVHQGTQKRMPWLDAWLASGKTQGA